MDFKVYQKELELQSRGWVPTFHDVTKEVNEIVAASGVKNGAGFYDYSGGKAEAAVKRRDTMFLKLAKCLFEDADEA